MKIMKTALSCLDFVCDVLPLVLGFAALCAAFWSIGAVYGFGSIYGAH